MKAKLTLLSMLFLLQSCYTYKQLDTNHEKIVVGQRYKLKHLDSGKFRKGKVVGLNDGILTFKTFNGEISEFRIDDVQEIKKGKFALGKTITISATTTAGFFGALWLAINGNRLALGSIDWNY